MPRHTQSKVFPFISSVNYASIQAAIDAVQAAGGGTVVVPAGTYTEGFSITDTENVHVIGYGATLQATANNQSIITISQALGHGDQRCTVEGFKLDGNSKTGVTGLRIEDTDGAVAKYLYIQGCAKGIHFINVAEEAWNERSTISDTYIFDCTIGIDYSVTAGAAVSFNETALYNVGISGCTTGINQGTGADFTRTTWTNVTIWPATNGYGVKFDGRLDFSRLTFGVEALTGVTGITGIYIGANYTSYADASAHDINISFVGSFANKVVDDSENGGICFKDGITHWVSDYAETFKVQKTSESYPRLKMDTTGFKFGDGGEEPPIQMSPWYDTFMNMAGSYVFQDNMSIGTDAEPRGVLDVGGEIIASEKSADPSNPPEGAYVLWMSDGTGAGDDGDVMMKITAGGVSKTVTLVDFSAV